MRDGVAVNTCDWVEVEDSFFCCLYDMNAICKIDKISRNASIIGVFPDVPLTQKGVSVSCKQIDDNIVFCPYNSNHVAIYNVSAESMRFISVDPFLTEAERKLEEKFYDIISLNNIVYLFGYSCRTVLKLDLCSGKISPMSEWVNKVCGIGPKEGTPFFSVGVVENSTSIYLPLGYTNRIVCLNKENEEIEFIVVPFVRKGIYCIAGEQGKLVLSELGNYDNRIFLYSLDTCKEKLVELDNHDEYTYITTSDENIFVFMIDKGVLYHIGEYGNDEPRTIIETDDLYVNSNRGFCIKSKEKQLNVFLDGRKEWILYSMDTGISQRIQYFIRDKVYLRQVVQQRIKETEGRCCLYENEITLPLFLDVL